MVAGEERLSGEEKHIALQGPGCYGWGEDGKRRNGREERKERTNVQV